jgi:adenosylhomocysteine nucleosidase
MKSGIVGVIGAMDNEIELLKSSMNVKTTDTLAGMTYYCGMLSGHPVALVRCGIGKVNAAICAQTLIHCFGAEKIINTGVAGSLDNEIDIGDIVVSTDAVQHDMDVTRLGYKRGDIPGNELSVFPADEKLRKNAMESAAAITPEIHVFEGRVASGDQFIADSARKQAIVDDFGAMCCEMEGAAIAQVCAQNKVPFVIIRAISDKADDSGHMDYRVFVEAAAKHSAAIVRHMIENQ